MTTNTHELIEALDQALTDYFCDEGEGGAAGFIELLKVYGLATQPQAEAQPAGDVRERVARAMWDYHRKRFPNDSLIRGEFRANEDDWDFLYSRWEGYAGAAIAALSATPAVSGWRDDMENAPRDGTRILLSHGRPVKNAPRYAYIGNYLPQYDQWLLDSGLPVDTDKFRYWMPIEPLPHQNEGGDGDG
jgi:hypothetical protein